MTRRVILGYACVAVATLAIAGLTQVIAGVPIPIQVQLPSGGRLTVAPRETAWAADDRLPSGRGEPGQHLGLRTSVWLGVMKVDGGWVDFRGQRVANGTYDLCYALQPRRKEHAGLDAIRDFAVLVPTRHPQHGACTAEWLSASRGVTATGHPAVLALISADEVAQSKTREPDWVVTSLDIAGETIGFVLVGRAPLAEAF